MHDSRKRPGTVAVGRFAMFLALAPAFIAPARAIAADPSPAEFFETRVRPVLVESCGKCHGARKQSSGLRLDSREAILEGGLNGPAIVPGDPDGSLLVQVVRKTHEDIKMPPKGTLPGPAVESLAAWVKMAAPWPAAAPNTVSSVSTDRGATHWAFQPIKPVPLPSVNDPGWVRTPVDAFIRARLDAAGIGPSPEASRPTLIRRLTFDLTGLPPTPDEVTAFLNDSRPDAYEHLVDRLLASPRYGERWARHWLDVARYADTKGYIFNQDRRYPYSYTYRDYVVRAFNDDKPYDAFVIDQIAADRLGAGSDPGALAALGFLTVGRRYLNNNEDIIDDRIDVVSRGLLGLTVACARCHDHKFDPIPTDDYYSLFGIFASSVEPADPPEIPAAVSASLADDFRAKLAERQGAVDAFLKSHRAAIQDDLRGKIATYLKAAFDLGFTPSRNDPKLDARAKADSLTPTRLRIFSSSWRSKLDATRSAPDPIFAPWHAFAALSSSDFATKATSLANELAGRDPKTCNPVLAHSFAEKPPATMADVAARYGDLLAEANRKWSEAVKTGAKALDDPGWESLRQLLYADDGVLALPADGKLRFLDKVESNELTRLKNKLDTLKATHPGSPPRAMVLNDKPNPVRQHVFLRGNPGRQGKEVPRQFLKVLAGPDRKPFGEGSGRLELARAIASRDNPLTARVFVNRVWLNHFGAGLVTTPSDFGVRCEPPSHPELLDWLADDFMRQGWSIKALHRRIVLSSTYRQRSDNRPEALAKDPLNRLVWKYNRHRIEFEAMRDALLVVSGTLDSTMGGRSVAINDPPFPPRRTIYGFIDRLSLDSVYRAFDFASPDASSPRRLVTTVPQQALFLMNSPFVIAEARRLAALVDQGGGTPEVRVGRLYQRLFGREPDPGELALGVEFVRRQEAAGPSLPPPPWSYGFGRIDAGTSAKPLADFRPLPHWTGSAWQFGPTLPDPEGRYLHRNAQGGHAGQDPAHVLVLRWTAPHDATIQVEATLGHAQSAGDGVRGRIVSSRAGLLGDWVAHNDRISTPLPPREVQRGETLDFLVDCRQNDNSDTFTWAPTVRVVSSPAEKWDAKAEFHGPTDTGLTPWEEYAQVLILTNEFVFVD